jgi:aminoglycoside phosphotransferase
MSFALSFLERHPVVLERAGVDPSAPRSFTLLTPRFRTSRHVVYLVFAGRPQPALVLKVPRLPGDDAAVEHEATVLRAIETADPELPNRVPRVLAVERYRGRAVLAETALRGDAMDPACVRKRVAECCAATTDWLIRLASCGATGAQPPSVESTRPLRRLEHASRQVVAPAGDKLFEHFPAIAALVQETREATAALTDAGLRPAIEHGDVSHPNILWGDDGIGIVDWESANLNGLPAADLFFFLAYVALARRGAHNATAQFAAWHEAFFGKRAWAWCHVARYADRIGLKHNWLVPLFVLCWAHQTARLAHRLAGSALMLSSGDFAWLRSHRWLIWWQYALSHRRELEAQGWCEMSGPAERLLVE